MDYMTVKEAAELMGISTRSVYAAIERGELKALERRGYVKGYRISRQEVDRWMRGEWVEVAR